MTKLSLPVDQISREHAAYYGEVARLYGDKNMLSIEDVRRLPGKAKMKEAEFEKLIAEIRRQPDEPPGKPLALGTSPVVTRYVDIDFIRADIIRIFVKDNGALPYLPKGLVYYFDSTKPLSMKLINKKGAAFETQDVNLLPDDKLRLSGNRMCYSVRSDHCVKPGFCIAELESPNKSAERFGNIKLGLSIILMSVEKYLSAAGDHEKTPPDPALEAAEQVRSLSDWMFQTSPYTEAKDKDGWLLWKTKFDKKDH
jgi:hypothetical protein